MTICELRKQFPHGDFYFFKNGYEMQKAPFFHSKIKSYKVKGEAVFIYM